MVLSSWIIILVSFIIHSYCRHHTSVKHKVKTRHHGVLKPKYASDILRSQPLHNASASIVDRNDSFTNYKEISLDSLNDTTSAMDALLEDTVTLMETFELDKYRRREIFPSFPNTYYTPTITETARRICNPGPIYTAKSSLKNCLIIGDSISNGYFYTVREELKDVCQVQHGPLPKASGAIDTRYGLQCLDIMLSTASLQITKYDVILFNFGLHDVNFSGRFPEEYVPLQEYINNLSMLKTRLQSTGAQLVFALTTPVPYNKTLNKKVLEYNHAAKRLMKESGLKIIDLYKIVVKKCGHPPYKKCRIMRKRRDVHYNIEGCKILGRKVAKVLRNLLNKGWNVRRKYFSTGMNFQAQLSYACPDRITHCPYSTTCSKSQGSPTGYGCCMLPQAVNCPDSWHCCPQGSQCSADCTRNKCSCVIPQNYFTR